MSDCEDEFLSDCSQMSAATVEDSEEETYEYEYEEQDDFFDDTNEDSDDMNEEKEDDSENAFHQAILSFEDGEFDDALELFSRVLELLRNSRKRMQLLYVGYPVNE